MFELPGKTGKKSAKHRLCAYTQGYMGVFYPQHKSSRILLKGRLHVEECVIQIVLREARPGLNAFLKCVPVPNDELPNSYQAVSPNKNGPNCTIWNQLNWILFLRGCLEYIPSCIRIGTSPATGGKFPQALKVIALPLDHAEGSMGQRSLVSLG